MVIEEYLIDIYISTIEVKTKIIKKQMPSLPLIFQAKNKKQKTLQLQFSLLKRLGAKFQDLVGVSIYLGIGQKREHTISTQPPPPN